MEELVEAEIVLEEQAARVEQAEQAGLTAAGTGAGAPGWLHDGVVASVRESGSDTSPSTGVLEERVRHAATTSWDPLARSCATASRTSVASAGGSGSRATTIR